MRRGEPRVDDRRWQADLGRPSQRTTRRPRRPGAFRIPRDTCALADRVLYYRRRLIMLLEGKNAVIYGGGGSVGGAVARTFALEGANVFLAGRTREPLEMVASDIEKAGGRVEVAELDALDEQAVEEHMGELVDNAGSIDVSFNAISIQDVQLIPLVEMSREDFMRPISTGTATHFLTARAAARCMARQGSGVILTFSASSVRAFFPGVYVGGFGIACTAIEALTKQLAAELGP